MFFTFTLKGTFTNIKLFLSFKIAIFRRFKMDKIEKFVNRKIKLGKSDIYELLQK